MGTGRSDPQGNITFSIFATFPAEYFTGWWGPFVDQVVGTAFLVMFVMALIDMRNKGVQANLGPFMIGLVVAAIGLSFGANAGYAINPARDLGPRLFAWAAGWGEVAMPGTVPGQFSWYFWIPIVGPLVGGAIGVLIYDLFIGDVLHARQVLADRAASETSGGAAAAEADDLGEEGPGEEEPASRRRRHLKNDGPDAEE